MGSVKGSTKAVCMGFCWTISQRWFPSRQIGQVTLSQQILYSHKSGHWSILEAMPFLDVVLGELPPLMLVHHFHFFRQIGESAEMSMPPLQSSCLHPGCSSRGFRGWDGWGMLEWAMQSRMWWRLIDDINVDSISLILPFLLGPFSLEVHVFICIFLVDMNKKPAVQSSRTSWCGSKQNWTCFSIENCDILIHWHLYCLLMVFAKWCFLFWLKCSWRWLVETTSI